MKRERRQPARPERVAEWGRQAEASRRGRCDSARNLEMEVRFEQLKREHGKGGGRS